MGCGRRQTPLASFTARLHTGKWPQERLSRSILNTKNGTDPEFGGSFLPEITTDGPFGCADEIPLSLYSTQESRTPSVFQFTKVEIRCWKTTARGFGAL